MCQNPSKRHQSLQTSVSNPGQLDWCPKRIATPCWLMQTLGCCRDPIIGYNWDLRLSCFWTNIKGIVSFFWMSFWVWSQTKLAWSLDSWPDNFYVAIQIWFTLLEYNASWWFETWLCSTLVETNLTGVSLPCGTILYLGIELSASRTELSCFVINTHLREHLVQETFRSCRQGMCLVDIISGDDFVYLTFQTSWGCNILASCSLFK